MKTFTAEEFNKSPAQVYREADKNDVVITHKTYSNGYFLLKFIKTELPPGFARAFGINLGKVKEEK